MRTLGDLNKAKALSVECPSCRESFPVRKARLVDGTLKLPLEAAEYLATSLAGLSAERAQLKRDRAELHRRFFASASSSGVVKILEMVAASLPDKPISPRDCRLRLRPFDYIAFVGASRGAVEALKFVAVKTSRNRLIEGQRAIKKAVDDGKARI